MLRQTERLILEEKEGISDKNEVSGKESGGRIQSTGREISLRQEERSSPIVIRGTNNRVCAGASNRVCLVRRGVNMLLSVLLLLSSLRNRKLG